MSVFKGNTSFYEYKISDNLAYNLKSWLDYGFIECGAYTNVAFNLSTSGYSNLKKVKDDRYADGKVYEGFGPSWIWESGVSGPAGSQAPIVPSGIYIDNAFYPTTTGGAYSHTIDFERGRVIFNSPVSGHTIQCQYSIRDVAVYQVDSKAWKTVIANYAQRYNETESLSPSGVASKLKEDRVWLPAVFIDVHDRSHDGLQLGGGELADISVFYHVFSDRPGTCKIITDIINDQENKVLNLFDINNSPRPLNYDGSLSSGAKTYTQLADRSGPYFMTYAWIEKSNGRYVAPSVDLYRGEVRQNIRIERYGF